MSAPQIPPRPARSQHPAMENPDAPQVPPRPVQRSRDRTQSPNTDSFPRSPLNDVPLGMSHGNKSGGFYNQGSQNASSSSLHPTHRPPSVSLPSLGQEGSEYADIGSEGLESPAMEKSPSNEPTQTRNVDSDLPLHAPRPSFSNSTAKARVSAVTRTDSTQAAALGIGKAPTPSHDDKEPHLRNLRAKGSFARTESSVSTERPGSAQASEGDHGIPEIPGVGQRVPMYPNAGDVQAPSPSPYSQTFPSGVGFHNQGSKPKHHDRTKSGREVFHGPPGSYGLHGHGVPNADQFEKAWYDKHPEALEREGHGQYGPGLNTTRGEWALSSDDLNKLVRETASRGAGFGTSPGISGLPNEQIGYLASEEYASKINTAHAPTGYHHKAHSNHSQPHVESPLRKASFPVDVEGKETFEKSHSRNKANRDSTENALESETEDEKYHVGPPAHRKDKITGNGYDPPTEDLGPEGGNTENQGGFIEEIGYGVPILASDEVAKEPGSEYMQPAVSPPQERRGSQYYSGVDSEAPPFYQSGFRNSSRSGSASNSRPSSRPGSFHGSLPSLARFTSADDREDMHTPLEDVEEYEPLFPEEEGKAHRPIPASERFKRREMKRFPSQDIWEDTPNSLQLQATVNTPESVEAQTAGISKAATKNFESPEAEKARKGEVAEEEKAKLVPKEERLMKSHFKPHLREEMHRPGMKQRFPSRDIWEDSPDSARLETTVGGPQDEAPASLHDSSMDDEGLRAGAVVSTSGRPDTGLISGEQARYGATVGAEAVPKPSVPPRPARTKDAGEAKEPTAKATPTIPARPPKRLHKVPPADAEVPLAPSKASAETSPVETKQVSPTDSRKGQLPVLPERPKPEIPPRPANPIARDSSEAVPLSTVTSAASAGSTEEETRGVRSPPPAPKPKPAVPSRPAGGKIAALKAGFLSDLDKRLQLGPQATKAQEKAPEEPEQEVEKAPLADARKGRAKGPARRKPAVSPAAAEASTATNTGPESRADTAKWAVQQPWTVWTTQDDGLITLSRVAMPSNTDPEPTPLRAYSDAMKDSTSAMASQNAKQLEASHPGPLATLAKESSVSKEPVSLDQAAATTGVDIASPQVDAATEMSTSNEVNTPTSSKSNDLPPVANATSQTGERNITANAGTSRQEKITAILGGGAQAEGEGNVILRESEGGKAQEPE